MDLIVRQCVGCKKANFRCLPDSLQQFCSQTCHYFWEARRRRNANAAGHKLKEYDAAEYVNEHGSEKNSYDAEEGGE